MIAATTFALIQVGPKSDCIHILQVRMLAVAPDWQGKGYGARLVNHLKEWSPCVPLRTKIGNKLFLSSGEGPESVQRGSFAGLVV